MKGKETGNQNLEQSPYETEVAFLGKPVTVSARNMYTLRDNDTSVYGTRGTAACDESHLFH